MYNLPKKIVALSLPIALLGGVAFAGGLAAPIEPVAPIAPVAPMAPSVDWTGAYVGGQLGYGGNDTDILTDDEGSTGAVYGVHAGYMYDFGTVVAGIELDVDGTELGADEVANAPADISFDAISRLKGRVGYDFGNFLPYATGGIVSMAITDNAADETFTDTGYFFGGGVAYKATDSIIVSGEVLNHRIVDFNDEGFEINTTTGTLRLSYQF